MTYICRHFSPTVTGKQLSHKMSLEHISFIVGLLVNIGRTQEHLQKPTVVGDPSSAVGFQGGSFLIHCTTPISVDRKIYLFRGSETIFEENSTSNEVVTFALVNLTSHDQGIYRCLYETLHSPRRKSPPSDVLRLKVKEVPAPFSQLLPSVAAVPEGGNLTLTCKANNTLRCVFYTNRGDRYIPLHLPQGKTRTSLSLTGATSDDAGRYACNCYVERNELSVLSAVSNVMTLTVNGNIRKPNISFEHTTGLGLLGGSIVIKCEVPAEGEKNVSILKDSEKISTVNSLSESEEYFTFLHLTSRSAGHYQCIYETILPNEGKSPPSDTILLTILDVNASRSVLNFSALELTVGGSLRMSCHANSMAKCLFFEYGDEDSLGRPMLEATSNNAVELAKVSLCDSGDYVCLCLMEIDGVEAISAASEPVTFRVIEGSKGTGMNSKPDDIRDGPLFIVLTIIMFMILLTLCVILGVYLSRNASKQHKKSTPLEMDLQVTC